MHKGLKKISFEELILLETEDYTVINKPPHIASLDDRANIKNLLSLAKEVNPNYQIGHRLDKETSGVVVFAKNPEAYRHFAMQLDGRQVKKVYHAVAHGQHHFEDLECDEPLQTTSTKSRVDFRAGKPAFTLVSTLEVYRQHTLLKCFPVTGRMHQIRAHLAHQNAPLIGDPLYGGADSYLSELKRNFNQNKWEEEKPMISRVALHSFKIAFKDLQNETQEVEAPYPKDFSVLIKLLEKFN